MGDDRTLTAVPGLQVGHWTDSQAATGCTVVLGPADGMRAAAYLRGRATGTRELDALHPNHIVPRIHALLLTGGSAYGLGAADGVMRWLAERKRGFPVGEGVVPIVPAAVVFDLAQGQSDRWPGPDEGYAACDAAGAHVPEGSVGAGTGATVGKVLGPDRAMQGGVGTWAERRNGCVVAALAVVNAFGDVRDAAGTIIAGARTSPKALAAPGTIIAGARGPDGAFADARTQLAQGAVPFTRFGNTTLIVVATDAAFDKAGLAEVARAAADALSWRITPVGTQVDGDIVFALSVGDASAGAMQVELLAQDVTAMAIERAVRQATGTAALPGLADG